MGNCMDGWIGLYGFTMSINFRIKSKYIFSLRQNYDDVDNNDE